MTQSDSHFPILITGDTLEAWLAAVYLARVLTRTPLEVAILPVEYSGEISGAIVALPEVVDFHAALGFDERDLLRFCGGCFRLGALYEDWSAAGSRAVHAYGASPPSPGEGAFHQYWNRVRGEADVEPYSAYSLAASMAATDRFNHPGEVEAAEGHYRYGYHFNAARYREYLKRAALHYGARLIEPGMDRIHLSDDNGSLAGLQLADGRTVTADTYVDASGFGLLAGALAGSDWQHDRILPFNAQYTVEQPPGVLSRSRIVAQADSLLIETPTVHSQYRSLVFESGKFSRAEAAARLGPGGTYSEFHRGYRQPWRANCLALGPSAFHLGPLEGVSLQLIMTGVLRLAELFPGKGAEAIAAAEYNRRMMMTYHRLRDLQGMHYALSGQPWAVPEEKLSAENRIRLEQFRSRGRVVTFDDETFSPDSWTSIMLGHGVHPRRVDPLATVLPVGELRQRLRSLREHVRKTCESLPTQRVYLEQANAIAPIGERSPA